MDDASGPASSEPAGIAVQASRARLCLRQRKHAFLVLLIGTPFSDTVMVKGGAPPLRSFARGLYDRRGHEREFG
jgi:hypothetical protein